MAKRALPPLPQTSLSANEHMGAYGSIWEHMGAYGSIWEEGSYNYTREIKKDAPAFELRGVLSRV